jgi:hypothetical protein
VNWHGAAASQERTAMLKPSRRRWVTRVLLAVLGGGVLTVVIWLMEQQRPTIELERAGAAVVQDSDGSARTVSFCSPAAGDAHLRLIAQLPTVTSVNLARSSVTASGVRRLAKLPKLHTLDLSETTDGPGVLEAVAEFPALRTLQLRRCAWLTDAELAPLAQLRSLECLMIAECEITDASLQLLLQCSNLKQLGIDRCPRITDAGLTFLAAHSQLETVSVNDCRQLTDGGVRTLACLPSLQSLSACGIPVHRPVLREIAAENPRVVLTLDQFEIPELQPLLDVGARIGLDAAYNVRWVEIDDRWQDPQLIPAYTLAPHAELNKLYGESESQALSVSAGVLDVLALVPDVSVLYLRDLPISDAGLAPVRGLRNLRHLVMENVPISDAGLRPLAECAALEKLWLQRVPVSGTGVAVLRDLPQLRELSLLSDRVTQAGIEEVTKLERLDALAIGDVSSASIAEHVSAMPHLTSLALVRATLTREDMERLATAPHLQQLEMLRVNLPGDALTPLADMSGLRSLFLARCEYDREAMKRLHLRRPDLLVYGAIDMPHGPRAAMIPERRRLLGGIPLFVPHAPATVH